MSSPNKTNQKNMEVSSVSFPVKRRLILKKTIIPFLFFVSVYFFLVKDILLVWWLLAGLLIAVIILTVINYYYMKVFYYRLEDEYILIKRHALNPKEIFIEYIRIKDIVIHRDLLDRLFGLYQIRFELYLTSPTARKMAYIDGLDEVEAKELKVVVEHQIEKSKKPQK